MLIIPCKGTIKSDFFNSTTNYICKNFQEFNVTYHYSLYHQYSINKEKSYQDFKDFFNNTIKYISNNHQEFNVTYHYSLYHQYSQNKEKSYKDLLDFLKNSYSNRNYEILLVSGSNKKKNFDSIDALAYLQKEKDLKVKLGIAYNPYLKKYYKISTERERFERKISTGLINSIWFQYGTDINAVSYTHLTLPTIVCV